MGPQLILEGLAIKTANGENKNISPLLGGLISRAIFTGSLYPESLYAQTISRIRADRDVSYIRAAVLKACLMRKYRDEMKEVLTVSLNEQNPSIGYRLGRLLATFDRAQEKAIFYDREDEKSQSSIANRSIGAASTMPERIFPSLLKLNSYHLSKLISGEKTKGTGIWLSKLIMDIMDGLPSEGKRAFPVRLNNKEQGEFFIGYYQQKKEFFRKTEDKKFEDFEQVEE